MRVGYSMDNDTRGWIMCIVSGIACIFGSSIICIDLILRHIPRWKDFRIQDSSVFLGCSMSLSFGVMIFSALYSMLPSSKRYLERAELSAQKAAWMLLGFFILGFVGIQIISRFLHHYMPSHVVDCHHSHDEISKGNTSRHVSHASHACANTGRSRSRHHSHGPRKALADEEATTNTESTPLLNGGRVRPKSGHSHHHHEDHRLNRSASRNLSAAPTNPRRPSMVQVQSRVMSFVKDTKTNCDESGPCFGYSEPCGRECLKHFPSTRSSTFFRTAIFSNRASFPTSETGGFEEAEPVEADAGCTSSRCRSSGDAQDESCCSESGAEDEADLEAQHHHHVPENAFMSIGLQTSIAIALHKLPEGFITYATNHASPALGFSVFMALFIHNITEGFAMALPLYLALGSRTKAMGWASLLGGISQPLGAGIAALLFTIQGHRDADSDGPGFAVYGCMFAVTAGIMTSVALQLFVEGVGMCHRKELCIGFAMLGMALLAGSNALTA